MPAQQDQTACASQDIVTDTALHIEDVLCAGLPATSACVTFLFM